MTCEAESKRVTGADSNIEFLNTCNLCGSGSPFWILAEEDLSRNRAFAQIGVFANSYMTVLCRRCGWVFKPGKFNDEQLARLYSEHGGDKTHRSGDIDLYVRSVELYELLGRHVDVTAPLRVLDIGGGAGQVSVAFARQGHEVHIVDIAAGSPVDSRMQIHRCALTEFHDDRLFDLVLISHVLEHVWSPLDLLRLARSMTKPGGHLYIEVPFELYTPFLKGKLGDPCHVGYFSIHALRRFVMEAGLEAVFSRRGLGRYNARRVMVLRMLARYSGSAGIELQKTILPGWLLTVLEMIHPQQLVYVLFLLWQRAHAKTTSR